MRLAAVSDIHGNVLALEAVLADIARRGVETILNLGDIVSGPLWPAATADLLMSLDLPTIAGNHERQVLAAKRAPEGGVDAFAREDLTEFHMAWLASLPSTLSPLANVLMVHGTPRSDVEYFLETVSNDGLRLATRAELEDRASGIDAPLILCGHTHLPGAVRLRDDRMIVNPGSVGLPAYDEDLPHPHRVETRTPHARYAIAEKGRNGWAATLIAVEYDWEAAAQTAERNGRPDWAIALRTGYVD